MNAETGKKIKHWLLYGIFWSIAPILIIVIPTWVVGYDVDIDAITPDYLLVVFAVSVNLYSCKADFSVRLPKRRFRFLVTATGVIAFLSMFLLGSVYLAIFNGFTSEETLAQLLSSNSHLKEFCLVASGLLLLDTVLGVALRALEGTYSCNSRK